MDAPDTISPDIRPPDIRSPGTRPLTLGPAEPPRFAALLRERTQTVHREAERSGFVADLLSGRATRLGYAAYLGNLLPVYEALERRLGAAAADPALQAFADPRLARACALRRDLQALGAADFGSAVVRPEARAYAAAIEAPASGPTLMGHAYARYLGDLSGGQILKPLLARTLGLAPEQLQTYDFPGLDVMSGKAALRAALDRIEPASPDAEAVIAAATAAFRHTIALACALSTAATAGP